MLNDDSKFIENICNDINLSRLKLTKKQISDIWSDKKSKQVIIDAASSIEINTMILVKNQEKHIKECIETALMTSDHVFVFDTGSKDNTISIVNDMKNENDIILKHLKWREDYSYMRNYAASYMPDGWILILDSDEFISPPIDLKYLKLVLSFIEFIFPRNDLSISFRQKDDETSVDVWPERMYKKTDSVKFYGYVHEELRSDSLIQVQSQFTVNNSGTRENEIIKFDKEKRYFELGLKNYHREPNNVKWVALMPFDEAFKYDPQWYTEILEKYIKQAKEGSLSMPYEGHIICDYIQVLIIGKNDLKKAEDVAIWAMNKFPNDSRFYCYKYLIENEKIRRESLKVIVDFKKSVNYLEQVEHDNDFKWEPDSVLRSTDALEKILNSLLSKAKMFKINDNSK